MFAAFRQLPSKSLEKIHKHRAGATICTFRGCESYETPGLGARGGGVFALQLCGVAPCVWCLSAVRGKGLQYGAGESQAEGRSRVILSGVRIIIQTLLWLKNTGQFCTQKALKINANNESVLVLVCSA